MLEAALRVGVGFAATSSHGNIMARQAFAVGLPGEIDAAQRLLWWSGPRP